MIIHDITKLNIFELPKFTPEKKPKKFYSRYEYNKQICAFDIETTGLKDLQQSVMYVWQFAIEDFVIIGRTWDEFKKLVSWLNTLSHGRKIVVYVHNLSYEIQFLSGIFHFDNENIFPTESRKVLKANLENLEFRCSYLLTNLSLKAFTARYNVEHKKLDGEDFDYSKMRFSDTPLSYTELSYCVNDVLGLVEALHALFNLNNDNVYTIPLTATGFVRRVCKKNMQRSHGLIMETFPDYEVFDLLRKAFRGGNTHANRYLADELISGTITSMDIASSYPFQQVCKEFPVYPFEKVHSNNALYLDKLIDRNKPFITRILLSDVRLRNKYTAVPYLALDKLITVSNPLLDNGRIISCKSAELCITDVDWKIICKQYEFKCDVITTYKSSYGKLPEGLVNANIEFYTEKTKLKGVKGQELFYLKNKEMLNSIYGMSVQNPVKRSILFNDGGELYIEDDTYSDEELLKKAKKRAFTCYQYGVWTTALARESLEIGLDICGDDLIYCDTDSCKFIGNHDFSEYNSNVQTLAIQNGLYADDISGHTHYGGVYEHDGVYEEFITLGAKKYAYKQNGKIHVTVSGVGKIKGAIELENAGGLNAFRNGFVFHNCGKTESIYNDSNLGTIEYNGRPLYITRNVYIKEQDYTLGTTEDYQELLNVSKQDIRKICRHFENLHAK